MLRRVVVALVVCLGGCGGGGGGPIPIDQLDTRVVQAFCDYGVRCGAYPDFASCMSATINTTPGIVADVKSGKTHYDAALAGACLDALASFGCDQSSANTTPAACDEAFTGTVAEGGACASGAECVSAICNHVACSSTVACCPGTCGATRVTVAEGGVCGTANTTCATGTFCQFSGSAISTCKRLGAVGAACTPGLECAAGLTCVVPAGANAGVCGPYPRTGEDCTMTGGECDARTDFCDPKTSKCAPRLAPGAACVPSANGCATYARCDAVTGKCVSRGGLGAACAQGNECYSSECTNGACVARPTPVACP